MGSDINKEHKKVEKILNKTGTEKAQADQKPKAEKSETEQKKPDTKGPQTDKKKDEIVERKKGQKDGEKQQDKLQKKLRDKNDFLFMFNKFPGNF